MKTLNEKEIETVSGAFDSFEYAMAGLGGFGGGFAAGAALGVAAGPFGVLTGGIIGGMLGTLGASYSHFKVR